MVILRLQVLPHQPARLPVAVALADSKSQFRRRAVLAGDRLTITHGGDRKDIASYRVTEIPSVPFPARAWQLDKLSGGTDAEAENYAVLIDPSSGHTCECRGFLAHGHCSHIDALVELLAEGALDADEPFDAPLIPFPSPEQVAEDADFDFPPYCRG